MAFIHISSAKLPADASVRRFTADEGLSRPYRVEVEFATAADGFVVADMIRERALATLIDGRGRRRHFDGFVEGGRFVGHTGTLFHFRLEIVPLLATLGHREDCRIFQAQGTVDVVKQVLADAGVDDRVDWRLMGDYPAREYVVQYRETDLGFVQRLLEDEGIFFYFEHGEDGHTLVFADHPDAFAEQPDLEPVRFGVVQGLDDGSEPLAVFAREHRLRPSSVHIRDFDFVTPQVKPEAAAAVAAPQPLEVYEYPGGLQSGDGQGPRRATARLEELRRDADVAFGQSQAVGLCPGIPFSVSGASEACCNGDFVVTELGTRGEQGLEGDGNIACENRFQAIPAGAPFAPPRRARRPRIRGLQTAIVTGPTNEQQAIHTDEHGRVKVRFHWDRAGIGDDRSSCWLRVGQLGLGGSMIIPRVGWEVAVAYQDGDPDRPFVCGRLYNGKHRPLVALPAKATCGTLKSLSTPGGAGHNVMGTDDAGGNQGFELSGKKDTNTFVGADKTESVGVNEKHAVKSNLSSTVGAAETWNVDGNQSINVGNALQVKVGGAQTISVGGSETVGAEANYIEAIGGPRSYSIGGSRITISNGVRNLVNGSFTRNVGALQVNVSASAINDGLGSTYDETVAAVKAELILGDSAENVGGDKLLTSQAAELHLVSSLTLDAASVSRTIGGVHLTKAGGNYEVSAPEIALVGGVGQFKGGGSSLKLNGGPVVATGSTITIQSALVRVSAGSLEIE